MTRNELERWIKHHEGYDDKPYICTGGKLTIGYGRNLQDNGLSREESEFLFDNDFNRVQRELLGFTWYVNAPSHVKDALFNMSFNLGLPRLLEFRNMIHCLINKDYKNAAREALDSKWARDVGKRATDVALMMCEGMNE